MIEHVHNQIMSELNQNTKTDTIFVITAILLNLMTLAINAALVKDSRTDDSLLIVMFVFVALFILVVVFTGIIATIVPFIIR